VIHYLTMAYQSYHCSAMLLCSTCINVFLLSIFLHFLFFFSVSACAPRISLPLSYMYIYSIFFFCVLCSVHHFHSMHYASSVHFIYCAQHASTHMNNYHKKKPSLLFFYVYLSCQVLCQIIQATLHILWKLS
jgi:hypothetical protein